MDKDLRKYAIGDHTWQILKNTVEILKCFKSATDLAAREKYPTIYSTIPIYNFLLDMLEKYDGNIRNTTGKQLDTEEQSDTEEQPDTEKQLNTTGEQSNTTGEQSNTTLDEQSETICMAINAAILKLKSYYSSTDIPIYYIGTGK